MTLTTAQAFTQFVNSISLTDTQTLEVSAKRTKTSGYLGEAFPSQSTLPLSRCILIGSADRGTLIRPLDDVDVMAEFANKDSIFETYRYRSGDFLQRIRTALHASTSISHIGARGQAVRLFYTSGAHVDIAPVFRRGGGGFMLPSGDGGWIATDPEQQASWMAKRRAVVGTTLTPMVKLAKRWNRVHSERFGSYQIEVMTAAMFSSLSSNYRNALKCFFDWAPNWFDVQDPAGYGGALSGGMTKATRAAATSRLAEAKTRAEKALKSEAGGDHAEAKRLWRIELGDEFPVN
ncbi:MAG: nucleotidyltransferase [Propionibacteriaceae bacterium]|nr:nucleotidyltransferase [Propionibacteriaceae bacterium]